MRRTLGITAVLTVLICAIVGVGSLGAQPARPRTQTASAPLAGGGSVSATITYTPRAYYAADLHLTITRAGRRLYSAAVHSPQCGTTCAVARTRAVSVADLAETGEPVVRLDLYTGGAHCCYVTEFYRYDAGTRAYAQREYDWGDPGYTLRRLGGQDIFETADDRFAYRFTDFAASGLPLQLLAFNGARLVDVTRRYPALIARNGALYLRAYRAQAATGWSDTVGVIAAWAADEDELGHDAEVAAYLDAQAAAGHLNSGEPGSAEGARFVRTLDAFLNRTGYLR